MSNTSAAGAIIRSRQSSQASAILRFLPLLACALLAACTTPRAPDLHDIALVVERDANRNQPFAFEIVYVYDRAALARLPRTSAEWFKPQAPARFPGGAIQRCYYELPPGTNLRLSEPLARGAIAVVGYADYIDQAGQPVLDLTGYRKLTMR